MLTLLLLIFGFAFGWNNAGLTVGNLSNLIRYRLAVWLTVIGVFMGLLIAGQEMSSSIVGKLVSQNIPSSAILVGISVSVSLLLILTLLHIPVSLSNCVVGSFVGAALGSQTKFSPKFLVEIVGSWIAAPFICALITFVAYEVFIRLESNRPLSTVSWINRLLLIVSVFYVSFTLGANNIGLIVSFAKGQSTSLVIPLELAIFVLAALGMILFGKSIAQVVGDKIVGLSQIKTLSAIMGSAIVTTILTILSVPVSLTQVIIGGMLGAGISRGPSVANNQEIVKLILWWTMITILSAGLAFGLSHLIVFGY
ncbi:MAG: inorganic phosphate transporter [Nitrososphaerales archaeon]